MSTDDRRYDLTIEIRGGCSISGTEKRASRTLDWKALQKKKDMDGMGSFQKNL